MCAEAFASSKQKGRSNAEAWADCYESLDRGFLAHANAQPDADVARALFAGACCTGAFIDLRPNLPCKTHDCCWGSGLHCSKSASSDALRTGEAEQHELLVRNSD